MSFNLLVFACCSLGVAAVTHGGTLESGTLHLLSSPDLDVVNMGAEDEVTGEDKDSKDAESSGEGDKQPAADVAKDASPKLQVGTKPGAANVVADFEVLASWQNGDDLESQVPAGSASTDFFLTASGAPLQLTRASVTPESTADSRNYLSGALAEHLKKQGQVNLKPNETRRLTVVYECNHPGNLDMMLTLELEGLSPVKIPWKKVCGGDSNTALTVTTGSSDASEKVVVMGSPKWDEVKVVGPQTVATDFKVFVDPLSEQGEQEISEPKAISSGVCSVKASSPITGTMKLQPGESTTVSVAYTCHRRGDCAVAVEVPFYPNMAPYRPTKWQFTKRCASAVPGIEVESELEGKKRLLVAAGHASRAPDWLVSDKIDSHKVRLLNDQILSQEPEIKVQSVRVRCLDTLRCTARIEGAIPEYLSAEKPTDVEVQYSCRTSGSSLVELMLSTENRDPVSVLWAKDCSAWADSLWFLLVLALLGSTLFAFACIGVCKFCVDQSELDPKIWEDDLDVSTA